MKKNDSAKWLNDLHMVRERIWGRAGSLEALSEAFARTGNEYVAKELALSVAVLRECAGTLNHTSGVICAMVIRQAGDASTNMLNAALAGVELASKKKDP